MSEQQERLPVDVYEFIAHQIEVLSSIAWSKMGLQPDMMTGQMVYDLDQAKIAVDAAGALAPLLEPHLDDSDRRQIQNLVRDLRINYVDKASNQ